MKASLTDLVPMPLYDRQVVAFYSYKGGVGRTMALCNVAARLSSAHAQDGAPSAKILCVDLDTDAPSLSAYLPPAPGEGNVRGILGLLHDCRQQCRYESQEADEKPACNWLRASLCEDNNKYAYKVDGTTNLYVMPVGNLPPDQRAEARENLRRAVDAAKKGERQGVAAESLPCFQRLSRVLRELYTYSLVDSRTGLSDESFAVTVGMADAIVVLFRSSLTQLLGIQDVLARFLYEKGVEAGDPNAPVIPVLSPRPPYTSRSLREIRKLAKAEVFKWLQDSQPASSSARQDYAPSGPGIIELPFDATVEIGERLLIPLDPKAEAEDSEAPLCKKYVALANAIQCGNAAHDMQGLRLVEVEHYRSGRLPVAFKCLLLRIAREPDSASHWEDVGRRYSQHLQSHAASFRLFWEFCNCVLRLNPKDSVPRFFANLWLSEVRWDRGPDYSVRLVRNAWSIAAESGQPALLQHGLRRLMRLYEGSGEKETISEVPSWGRVARTRAYISLSREPRLEDVHGSLLDLASWMVARPESNEYASGLSAAELLVDIGQLESSVSPRAYAFELLSKHAESMLDFETACAACYTSMTISDGSDEIRRGYVRLLLRLGDVSVAKSAIQQCLAGADQARSRLLLEILHKSPLDCINAAIESLQEYAEQLANDACVRAAPFLVHGRFEDAARSLEGDQQRKGAGFGLVQQRWLSLSLWLSRQKAIEPGLGGLALRELSKGTSFPLGEMWTCLALAVDPREVFRIAAGKLREPQFPLNKFGWAVLASGAEQGDQPCKQAVLAAIEKSPMLSTYTRRNEAFAVLRPVWDQLRRTEAISDQEHARACAVLDVIERQPAKTINQISPLTLAEPITKADDPRLRTLMEKWRKAVSGIAEDEEMSSIVNTVLKAKDSDEESA